MITVYPDPSDWNGIARSTGDDSWRHEKMWDYFKRCTDDNRFGWLTIDAIGPSVFWKAVKDKKLDRIVIAGAKQARHLLQEAWHEAEMLLSHLFKHEDEPDRVLGTPNHKEQICDDREGLYRIPLSIENGERRGVTEFLYDTKAHQTYGANLTLWSDCLATRVLLDGDRRAKGVEYLPRARAYRADRDPSPGDQRAWEVAERDLKSVMAKREVILCGGAFNSPQLLMLSGIGPRRELARVGIPVVVDRQGVGQNLQDRYEVAVIDELEKEFEVLKDYTFDPEQDDFGLQLWKDHEGLYTTNGGTIAIIRRSSQVKETEDGKKGDCDLFIFGIPGEFGGYKLDYSKCVRSEKGGVVDGRRRFSWVILKAHTENTGRLTLRTRDPRDPPCINFQNFKDGKNQPDGDMLALEEAVRCVREFMQPLRNGEMWEFTPGSKFEGQELRSFIMTQA
jgi:choline dehydrogenase